MVKPSGPRRSAPEVELKAVDAERQREEAAFVKATQEAEKELQSEAQKDTDEHQDVSQKRKQRHADHATQQEQDDAQQEKMEKALALRATWLSANSWEAMLAMIEHMNIYTEMDEEGMDVAGATDGS